MPQPSTAGRRYVPALDGLRAIAVLAVLAYHLNVGWASGGLLGVGMFFTLSGYLITDILVGHHEQSGDFGLTTFWVHRARRLLPALAVMLVVVASWVTLFERSHLGPLRGDVLAAIGYFSNWWLIFQNVSYFDRFGPPSPLGHLWSLAVEEQFYLIWPWLVVGAFWAVRKLSPTRVRIVLTTTTVVLAIGSAIEMALLFHPTFDNTRVYDGTDTRAFGLLFGAALAFVMPSSAVRTRVRSAPYFDALGLAALVGIGALVATTNDYSSFLYDGGLVVLSLATVALIAVVADPASRLGRLLGFGPLRWVGIRSYGIYLWHFPIIVLTNPDNGSDPSAWTRVGQVAASLVIPALSWRFIEDPIRRGALGRMWERRQQFALGTWVRSGWKPTAVIVSLALLATACVGMSSNGPKADPLTSAASIRMSTSPAPPPSPSPSPSPTPSASPTETGSAPPTIPPISTATTSCRNVVHIGDSTSDGLVSAAYLPDPSKRIDAQYARVGIRSMNIQISGGTSILETIKKGEKNAQDVASSILATGYHGCWVMALGTNDTADVYVGSVLNRAGRIAKMMQLIGPGQPVVWTTVRSLKTSGPYAEANMELWNQALLDACPQFPNMRVYDWASVVQPQWFISDGIHFTSAGYAQRSRLIADSVAHAFPNGKAPSVSCVVQ